jgi:hypothetical protein
MIVNLLKIHAAICYIGKKVYINRRTVSYLQAKRCSAHQPEGSNSGSLISFFKPDCSNGVTVFQCSAIDII